MVFCVGVAGRSLDNDEMIWSGMVASLCNEHLPSFSYLVHYFLLENSVMSVGLLYAAEVGCSQEKIALTKARIKIGVPSSGKNGSGAWSGASSYIMSLQTFTAPIWPSGSWHSIQGSYRHITQHNS